MWIHRLITNILKSYSIWMKYTAIIPEVNSLNCNNKKNNRRNKHRHLSLYLPSHLTPSPLFPLSSEGMSPLGLAVQRADPYMAGCAAPAADCPSNTSRAALGQEDHACCPFDPASSSCCSTQQHFVPLSPYHTLSYGTKTQNPVQKWRERKEERKKCGVMEGGG